MERVVDQFGDAAVLARPVLEAGEVVDLVLEYGNQASQHLLVAGPADAGSSMTEHVGAFRATRTWFDQAWHGAPQRFEFDNRNGSEPNVRRAVWELSVRRIDDYLLMVAVDSTESHERVALIEQADQRQRAMLDRLLESVTLWDPVRDRGGTLVDLTLDYLNPCTLDLVPGLRQGMRLSEVMATGHPDVVTWLRTLEARGIAQTTEFENLDFRFGDTTVRHGLLHADWVNGQVAMFLRDETRLIETLHHLSETAAQLATARDDERSRLAEALHDGPLQKMIGVQLQLFALAEQQTGPLATKLEELATALGEAANDVRSQSFVMFSHRIVHEHLVDAVRAELTRRLDGVSLVVDVADRLGRRRVPDDLQRLVVRTVGELVSNVVKHAEAGRATISMESDGRWLRVAVDDDGIGIDDGATLGFGLSCAHVQVQDAGGFLSLERRPEGGTTAQLTLPVRRSANQHRQLGALGSPVFGSKALGWFR